MPSTTIVPTVVADDIAVPLKMSVVFDASVIQDG